MTQNIDALMKTLYEWIARTGWPTHVEDEALANELYAQWLSDTHDQWLGSGMRDRESLRNALEAALNRIHTPDDASYIFPVLLLFLESRSRREGNNRAVGEMQ